MAYNSRFYSSNRDERTVGNIMFGGGLLLGAAAVSVFIASIALRIHGDIGFGISLGLKLCVIAVAAAAAILINMAGDYNPDLRDCQISY